MQGAGGAMAAHRDPNFVRYSELLRAQFLKGRMEFHRPGISQNIKMEILGSSHMLLVFLAYLKKKYFQEAILRY